MIAVKRSVLGDRFVLIADGEIKISQHAISIGIVRKIVLGLLQEFFGLGTLTLRNVKLRQSGPRRVHLWGRR